jgi:hypothetical protein
MTQSVKMILLVILGVAALWDGFTTVYGTAKIFGARIEFTGDRLSVQGDNSASGRSEPTRERKFFILFASTLFGSLVLGLLISSGVIFTGTNIWLKGLNGLAIVYDLLTSFIGNLDLIYAGQVVGFLGWFVLFGLAIFVSGSSLILALISKRASFKVFSTLAI